MCKKIKKSGANVVLIQKSILRDAYNELSLHFLAKMDILVVTDIERNDVEFISRTLGCQPIAHVDSMSPDKLGSAANVGEVSVSGSGHKVVKMTGVKNPGKTMTVLLRGSNKLVLAEADRSVHDAQCVVRSLVKKRFMIAGGGAAEAEISLRLKELSHGATGMDAFCMKVNGAHNCCVARRPLLSSISLIHRLAPRRPSLRPSRSCLIPSLRMLA